MNKSTAATSGAELAHPSRSPEFIPFLNRVCVSTLTFHFPHFCKFVYMYNNDVKDDIKQVICPCFKPVIYVYQIQTLNSLNNIPWFFKEGSSI